MNEYPKVKMLSCSYSFDISIMEATNKRDTGHIAIDALLFPFTFFVYGNTEFVLVANPLASSHDNFVIIIPN